MLESVLGDLRFVYLWREDVIAQAVSWARAEQTNLWHTPIDGPDGAQTPSRLRPCADR